MTQGSRPGVPRRTAVAGVVAAVLSASGCGIRLEDDAPRLPLLPTRTPIPAEAELAALTRDTAALAALADSVAGALADSVAGALAADLATLHRRQHTVLRTTLLTGGVPATDLDATPTAAPSPTPSPAARRAALETAEGAAAASAASFAGVADDLRATIASLHAQRYAAAALLAGRPPTVPLDAVGGDAVGAMAGSTAAAVYFVEVVGARSTGAQRARSDTTLTALRAVLADQLAGGGRPDPSLGHPLPFPVDGPAAAARLARDTLTTLRAGYGQQLGAVVASADGPGLAALTRWLGAVEVEAHRWAVALEPFPGLK